MLLLIMVVMGGVVHDMVVHMVMLKLGVIIVVLVHAEQNILQDQYEMDYGISIAIYTHRNLPVAYQCKIILLISCFLFL